MTTFGGSTAPSFAGFIQHTPGGYIFASKYTSPAITILVTVLHAFFSASNSPAIGFVCMWRDSDSALLASKNIGSMAVGSNSPGGQVWRVGTLAAPFQLGPSSVVWLGGYSEGGIVFSTYDTSPHAFTDNTGITSGPPSFALRNDTGQGPVGAYAEYSQLIQAGAFNMGEHGGDGLLVQRSGLIFTTGQDKMGAKGGGIAGLDATVSNPTTTREGSNGGGLAPIVTSVKQPTIKVWRPN
jgi:hypothetical protein